MALKDITEKIISDAHEEAGRILAEAEKEKAKIVAEKDREIVETLHKLKDDAKARVAEANRRAEFQARAAEKNAVLSAKRDLIEGVIKKAKTELAKISDKDFIKLAVASFKNFTGTGNVEVVCSPGKKRLIEIAVQESNMPFKLSEKELGEGKVGFVLVSKDFNVDYTINSLVEAQREYLEPKISKILFD